jgi:hypothetical protein
MIFSLTDEYEDDFEEVKVIKGYGDSTLSFFSVKPTIFFSKKFLTKLTTHLKENPGSNFGLIYKGFSLNTIKYGFKINGIQISGGNNTLKHILSPQQFLLSKIITIFYGNNIDLVTKSFLEISKNKSLSRAIHHFTSENDLLLLKEIKSNKEAYEQSTEDKKNVITNVESSNNIKKYNLTTFKIEIFTVL